MIRWNAGFVRGLAQSVLDRAKSIRTTLTAYTEEPIPRSAAAAKPASKKRATTKKSTTSKRGATARRAKRTDA